MTRERELDWERGGIIQGLTGPSALSPAGKRNYKGRVRPLPRRVEPAIDGGFMKGADHHNVGVGNGLSSLCHWPPTAAGPLSGGESGAIMPAERVNMMCVIYMGLP